MYLKEAWNNDNNNNEINGKVNNKDKSNSFFQND